MDSARAAQTGRHTGLMAKRFSVQADTREECVEGLELFVAAGLVPVMLPVQVRADGWMARAVPQTKAPAVTDDGRGPGVSG